jgi:aminoglycoside phosphotransferase (APT) family kinase protein
VADLEAPLEKIAEGREAELFLLPDGRVLRLVRPGIRDAEEAVRMEAAALAAAAQAGAPVPAVYEQVTRDGRPGLVLERLSGEDLLSQLGDRPWTVRSVARQTGRVHAELHTVRAPSELPDGRELIASRIGPSDAVPAALRDEALRSLEELPDGDRLCHGDFHPGNVLDDPDGPKVIDWHNAARGEPTADVARSWVVLEVSPLPPGASAFDRRLASIGRGLLLRGYLRAYAKAGEIASERLPRWVRVHAIQRLTQEIEGEREPLLRRLQA